MWYISVVGYQKAGVEVAGFADTAMRGEALAASVGRSRLAIECSGLTVHDGIDAELQDELGWVNV